MIAAILIAWPATAASWDYRLDVDFGDILYFQKNDLARLSDGVDFSADSHYNLLYAAPALLLSQGKQAKFFLSGDLLWQHESYNSSENEYSESSLETELTGAYLQLEGERFRTRIGIQPLQFGKGLISLDDGPALSFTAKLRRWSVTGIGGLILDQSPIAGLTLAYRPSMFDYFSLFGVWFKDDETFEQLSWIDEIFGDWYWLDEEASAEMAVDQYRFIDLTGEADLKWIGASMELLLNQIYLTAIAAYEWGGITVNHLYSRQRKNLNAFLLDVSAANNLTPWLSLELFLFTASGSGDFSGKTIGTFVSPLPNNTRTLIFFEPSWLDRDPTETLIFGGSTYYGVVAPGMTLDLLPTNRLLLTFTWGLFYPQKTPRADRDFYGLEMDFNVNYQVNRRTNLYLETAYFSYGNFFENQLNRSLDPAVHFGTGCRIVF